MRTVLLAGLAGSLFVLASTPAIARYPITKPRAQATFSQFLKTQHKPHEKTVPIKKGARKMWIRSTSRVAPGSVKTMFYLGRDSKRNADTWYVRVDLATTMRESDPFPTVTEAKKAPLKHHYDNRWSETYLWEVSKNRWERLDSVVIPGKVRFPAEKVKAGPVTPRSVR